MEFADNITVRNPRLWAPGSPNLYDVSFTVRVGGEKVAGYELKSGIRSIKVSNGRLFLNGQALNTRGLGAARGLQGPGLRDRQRAPRGAAQPGQGAGRDLDPHALPVPPVHARAGGPHGHPDLVRDPGLHGQDPGAQGAGGAAAGGRGAAPQHRGQREPPVGDAVVDRQRALLAARAGAGVLHQRGGQVRQGAGPDAAGRDRGRRLPELALPGRAVQVDRRARAQHYFGWYPGPERPDLRPHEARSATSTPSAPATRTRR